MAEALRAQLRDDAVTCLVLWATTKEYNPEDESVLREWAGHLKVSEEQLNAKLDATAEHRLERPPPRRWSVSPTGAGPMVSAFAAGAEQHFEDEGAAPGPGKRNYPDLNNPKNAKRQKMLAAVGGAVGDEELPYQNIGPAIGRKVTRFWGHDDNAVRKNKGNPWYEGVVTDYQPERFMHTVTYGLLTPREEFEQIALSTQGGQYTKVQDEIVDLKEMYLDSKKRGKSQALKKSKWLKKEYGPLIGKTPGSKSRSASVEC